MCVDHIGSPLSNARKKIEHIYSGPMESDLVDMMVQCDPDVSRFVQNHRKTVYSLAKKVDQLHIYLLFVM